MRTENNNHNNGVLPLNFSVEESQLSAPVELSEVVSADFAEPFPAEEFHEQPAEFPQEEYAHVRHPRVRRSSALIVMALSAVCGVIGGIVISRKANLSAELAGSLAKSFGTVFLERTLLGAAFLGAEFLLGFFALGDLLVWSVPLAAGLGLALRVAATEKWVLLPSSILLLFITAFGAAVSAGFSETLMTIARGGTVHLGNSPRKVFVLNFLGYLAAAVACALYEGIILNV